jgi:hypothetical protein
MASYVKLGSDPWNHRIPNDLISGMIFQSAECSESRGKKRFLIEKQSVCLLKNLVLLREAEGSEAGM